MNGAYKKINESNIEAGKLTKTTHSTRLPTAILSIEMESSNNHIQQQEPELRRTVSIITLSDDLSIYERNKNVFVICAILCTVFVGVILRILAKRYEYGIEVFELLNWLFLVYQIYCLVKVRRGKGVHSVDLICALVCQVLFLLTKFFVLSMLASANEK